MRTTPHGTALLAACALLGCGKPPQTPTQPSGSGWAVVGETLQFKVVTTGGDMLTYRIDWGNGDTSAWSEYAPDGTEVELEHCWDSAGTFELRAQARVSGGPSSGWSEACTVRVLPSPGFPDSVVGSIPVSGDVEALEVSPDGQYLYVAGERLMVFRTADRGLAAEVAIAANAVCALPEGDKLYALNQSGFWVVRTSDWTVTDSIRLCWQVHDIVAHSSGESAYATGFSFECYVFVIMTSDDSVVGDVVPEGAALLLAADPDSQHLYITGGDQSPTIDVFNTAQRRVTSTIEVGGMPFGLAVSPDGRCLYVADMENECVTFCRTSGSGVADRVALGFEPVGVKMLPSGCFAYIIGFEGEVAVLDTRAREVVGQLDIEARGTPWSVACSPDCRQVYVAGRSTGGVVVFRFRGQ
jgi:YVTN family beta-propeller protein